MDDSQLICKFAKNIMATTTTLNTTQRHLLQMFGRMSSESMLEEMKGVLLNYYAAKMQEGIDKYWDDNNMGEEEINAILNEHMRTPYLLLLRHE